MKSRLMFPWLTAALSVLALHGAAAQDQQNKAAEYVSQRSYFQVYFLDGGWMMWILLLGLVATVGLTIYLFISVSQGRMVPRKLVDTINQNMARHDIQAVYNLASASNSSYARCISNALLKVNFERDLANKASMVVSAEDTLDQEETKVNGLINYLNTISTLSPMLGLFGTVVGMMGAFGQLASGNTKPSDLSGDIGVAMLTTAGGLAVGIPAMFFYFYFKNRLAGITSEIQKQFNFAIDVLSGELRLGATAQETVAAAAQQAPPENP